MTIPGNGSHGSELTARAAASSRANPPLSTVSPTRPERRRHLQNILPAGSAIISEALSVEGRGHRLFELMCAHDLEGVVAKRLKDGYGSRVRWLKIKNPGYSQNEGRRELFDRSR